MANRPDRSVADRFADGAAVDAAVAKGVREAILSHARAGNPIAVWRDGRVVWLEPAEVFTILASATCSNGPG